MIVLKKRLEDVNYNAEGVDLWKFRHQNKGPILILDLDGTVRDDSHRLCLLPPPSILEMFPDNPNAAYRKYQAKSHLDEPVQGVIEVVKLLQSNPQMGTIVLSTGTASEGLLSACIASDQLEMWGISYDYLIMRHEDDQRHSVEHKLSCLELFGFTQSDYESRVFALDDAQHICDAFRGLGMTVLKVK